MPTLRQGLIFGTVGIFFVAVSVLAFWAFFYSLSSPEAYVEVERWKAIIGYGVGIPLMVALIALTAILNRKRK